ncbi:cytochrome P450 87A3 [Ricinus communis]|uniref:Cytochrome P450, putative n=1 Tax=Ricinus communis TaxID=3988 RepID=B9R9F1_RICCO|nr:cytochrome P450 87A3 [Ricinus communis]EEF51428.1 cytochrome P450, putative [Ricinus communis]|eukprot:XP_002510826.1 cytochrome P450 87A3 [Ricinus communis]
MVFVTVVGLSLLLCLAHWIYTWRNPKCNGKLPPGSMGFPIIGETVQYFIPCTNLDIPPFLRERMERYGSLFKTSIVGYKIVVSTDPEINHFIFQEEGKSFISWYVDSFTDIFGKDNSFFLQGFVHKYVRNLTLNFVGVQSLKERVLPQVEKLTCKHLQSWSSQGTVELKEAISTMIFNFSAEMLFSSNETESTTKLRKSYAAFLDGLICFPLYIPRTAYWKCLQGRKEAMGILKSMLEERRTAPKREKKDFLDVMVEETKKDGSFLTEKMVLDLLFMLPFAFFESTSSTMVLAVKFLVENPEALEDLTKEHEAILSNRKTNDSEITWEEYRSMTFTHMVINETTRLANIVPGIFRKAVKDVQIKGYTIPAGWMVVACPTTVHLNPVKYSDPLAFNPWRWQGEELHSGSKNYMAFGGGVRLCAGADFVKLQMAIFLHYLVTKYRWSVIKGHVLKKPGVVFPDGFHIQLFDKNTN